jgi:putative hemolysin
MGERKSLSTKRLTKKMSNNSISSPVDIKLIEQELNENTFVRKTNKVNNEIYIVNYHNSPNVVKEIGRLRELTFSIAGGGTGKELDLDDFDTSDNCYDQLIVYDREAQIIASGYRFIDCAKVLNGNSDQINLSTRHYFNFSKKFIQKYLPYTIELGRSWVHPDYQAGKSRKGLFALDNLWDGLGAIMVNNPKMKYFFGKVTMYTSYNVEARNALLFFINAYFPDIENLVTPIHPISIESDLKEIRALIHNKNFDDGLKALNIYLKERGERIPPLINTYMKLSPTMKSFGTAVNPDFGGVEETGILVTVADIYPEKKERHLIF